MNRKFTGSGLSAAIKKTMDSYEYGKPLVERNALTEFKIKVANTLEERLPWFLFKKFCIKFAQVSKIGFKVLAKVLESRVKFHCCRYPV